MSAANVDFLIDQGEDWTVQLVWNDFFDNPIPVVPPMRMDIKSPFGQVMVTLVPPDDPLPPDVIPPITYNTDSGLIQLHLDKTQTNTMQGGIFNYDLFCNVDDGEAFAGSQQVKLIYGTVTIRPAITQGVGG